MFGKVHDCIFGSSIMEESVTVRYIWMCLITIADKDGYVDETIPSLSRRFNVSVNDMIKTIDILMKDDISSRSEKENGKRLIPIRETFGWKLVNYEDYRDLQTSVNRKDYMRNYMRLKREKKKLVNKKVNTNVNKVNNVNSVNTLADIDIDRDINKNKTVKTRRKKSSDSLHPYLKDFCLAYKQAFNREYIISWGKDNSLAKRLPKGLNIAVAAARYCSSDDDFIAKNGHSFGIFCMKINAYMGGKYEKGGKDIFAGIKAYAAKRGLLPKGGSLDTGGISEIGAEGINDSGVEVVVE